MEYFIFSHKVKNYFLFSLCLIILNCHTKKKSGNQNASGQAKSNCNQFTTNLLMKIVIDVYSVNRYLLLKHLNYCNNNQIRFRNNIVGLFT